MKRTKLIVIFLLLLLVTACDNKTETTTIENVDFFEYAKMGTSAEVSYGDNFGSSEELLEDFLKIDKSDVREITEVDEEQREFSLYLYRSNYSDVLYRLQFYMAETDDDLGDELKVHAYKYLTAGEPVEGYFAITDKDFIEELEEVCELIY